MFTEPIIIIAIVLSGNTVSVTAGQLIPTEWTRRSETSEERWREEMSVKCQVRANQNNVKLEPTYICKNCPHVEVKVHTTSASNNLCNFLY